MYVVSTGNTVEQIYVTETFQKTETGTGAMHPPLLLQMTEKQAQDRAKQRRENYKDQAYMHS